MIASGQSRKLAMQRPSEDRVLSSATDDGGEEEVDLFVLTYNCGGFSHAIVGGMMSRWLVVHWGTLRRRPSSARGAPR